MATAPPSYGVLALNLDNLAPLRDAALLRASLHEHAQPDALAAAAALRASCWNVLLADTLEFDAGAGVETGAGVAGGFEQAAPDGQPVAAAAGGDFFQGNVVENGQHPRGGLGAFEIAAEPEKALGGARSELGGVEGVAGIMGLEIGDAAGVMRAEQDKGVGGSAHATGRRHGGAEVDEAAGEDVLAAVVGQHEGAQAKGHGSGAAARATAVEGKGLGRGLSDVGVGVAQDAAVETG
jgi:hypothetical protein